MNQTLADLLLGLIEGITEFLPISSTGHLLIAEHWLGARSDLFNIAIQAGAILAVVFIYRQRLWQLGIGFRDRGNRDDALKLGLAFGVTAVLGLLVKKLGVELPETLGPIAWALLVGGVLMLLAERIAARRADRLEDGIEATRDGAMARPSAIGWGAAALVGVAQVVAGVFPGTSRSAAAIFAALLFGGIGRAAATEFAFLVGIPTMFAATGYELLHVLRDGGAAGEDWTGLSIAFVVSALTAFAAVKWLLGYIVTHRFTVFSWYRIVLGASLLLWLWMAPSPASLGGIAPASIDTAPPPARVLVALDSTGKPSGAAKDSRAASDPLAARQAVSFQASRDAAAAKANQEYEALLLCVSARAIQPTLDSAEGRAELEAVSQGRTGGSPDPAWNLRITNEAAHMLEVAERAKSECDGIGERAADGSIYDLARRAAELGNRDAALCYVMGFWPMSQARWADGQELAAYRRSAPALIEAGIRAGDWRMLSLASTAAYVPTSQLERDAAARQRAVTGATAPWQSPAMAWLRTLMPDGDAERMVGFLRLQAAGTPDADTRARLDSIATHVAETLLSELQTARAAAWAESTFRHSFQGKREPDWTARMTSCS